MSVAELAGKFDDHYWMEKDLGHEFPQEFYDAIATGGWLGMTIPEEYGGHGLGITEATMLLEEVSRSGAAMNAASAIHLSIFGMQPVVKHGSEETQGRDAAADRQRRPARVLRRHRTRCRTGYFAHHDVRQARGRPLPSSTAARCGSPRRWSPRRSCCSPAPRPMTRSPRRPTGMTLFLTDLNRDHVDIRPIKKMGRNAVSSNELFIDDLSDPGRGSGRRGGQGFQLHPPRAQPGADADRRRGAGHRPGRVGPARSSTPTSAWCSTGRSA